MFKPDTVTIMALFVASLIVWGQRGFASAQTFVDPTADVVGNVQFGDLDYVAPFAQLLASGDDDDDDGGGAIVIGNESNVQDSVLLNACSGNIVLGEQAITAHGAAVVGPASIGEEGVCPDGASHCPSFVGFNAVVDRATVEKDAMVIHLARVARGIRIPSGCKVMPGKYITSQAQVGVPPACNPPKTEPVTAADRAFMVGVIEVNVEFAVGYTELQAEDPTNVLGINFNPETSFNDRDLPSFQSVPTRDPAFRNRIIGDVRLSDSKNALSRKMGNKISLRADEGDPLIVGTVRSVSGGKGMADRHILHALEHTQITLGNNGRYGFHSLVHGGPADFNPTSTGANFTLGDLAVFFRSQAGNNVTVGTKSLVQQANLPSGTTIPQCTVRVGTTTSAVEWCNVQFPSAGACGDD
jgi:carbonic anhydrase/acetyltransferase-like protein (isoleucine patch superfamily)